MGKTFKIHESDSQPIPEKTGWSALTTITTFDRGKTCSQKWRKENAVVPKRVTGFTPSSLFVESLIEQLCKLCEKDPLSQKKLYRLICQKLHEMKLIDKTYNVEEFQFMRSYYQQAIYNILTVSNSTAIDCKLEAILNQSQSFLSLPPPISSGIFDSSRYQNEFEEIEFIARGGFGRVFRVRNKVDGCEYAIKKICLRYYRDEQFTRALREVRTLAKLDHCNIVAYKAAWFEPFSGLIAGEDCLSSSGSKISQDVEPSEEVPESSFSERESREEVEDDSGNIVFANGNEVTSEEALGTKSHTNVEKEVSYHLIGNDYDNTKRPGMLHNHAAGKIKMLNLPEHYGILCDHSSGSSNKGCRGRKVPGTSCGTECAVLHIQMQLCKESLRKWLDLRNEALQQVRGDQREERSLQSHMEGMCIVTPLKIFQEILNGVEYMHSMHVVHHDLKPSNIFVEGYEYGPLRSKGAGDMGDGGDVHPKMAWGSPPLGKRCGRSQVRVGDFGLACHLAQPPTTLDNDLQVSSDDEGAAMAVVPTDSIGGGICLVQTGSGVKDGDKNPKEVIGTRLYAAPEQLEGCCSLMSDTYSLAIILFELLHPFFTAMERGKVISALRSTGNVPHDFERSHPVLAPLIKDMLSHNPSKRPPIRKILEVLQSVLPDHDNGVKVRNDSICSDDDIIVKETSGRNRSRANSFTQTYEIKESYMNFSQSWEEILFEENQVESSYCSNFTCHAVRELQDETICKLREENLKKDELIEELRGRILQLEISHKNSDEIEDKTSH